MMFRSLAIVAAFASLPAVADEPPIDTEWEAVGSVNNLLHGAGDTLFVTINGNHEVFEYTVEGELLAEWSFEDEVAFLAVAPNGDVFVNITNNHRVTQYSAEGEWLADYDYEGPVTGMVVTDGGWLMVNVNNTHRVTGSEVMGVIETNG